MAKDDFRSVDEYIAAQAEGARVALELVRNAVRAAVPEAQEVISYKMPTYKLNGRAVLHFAAWKKHYSLYPANERLLMNFRDELAPYEVRKSTIRFPLSQPVPEHLIGRIARFRIEDLKEQ